jgi:hypothetical protein
VHAPHDADVVWTRARCGPRWWVLRDEVWAPGDVLFDIFLIQTPIETNNISVSIVLTRP